MKIFVKTLKGTHFVIYVRPHDSVADVKKNIETTQGSDVYPAERLMLIHHGKVLKDPTTLEENQVVENNFIVVMLSKDRHSSAPPTAIQPPITFQAPPIHYPHIAPVHYDPLAPIFTNTQAAPRHIPVAAPQDYYMWDQLASAMPQENHRDLFPQGLPNPNASSGTFDFLRNSQQFQELRALVQQNPHMLQPMLQELARQNPPLMRLIQGHQADFLRLINEHVEGEGNILLQEASAIPQAVTVTLLERQAIERLEAMGFDRARALELFFACNKNEELAANYLLYHMHEFEE